MNLSACGFTLRSKQRMSFSSIFVTDQSNETEIVIDSTYIKHLPLILHMVSLRLTLASLDKTSQKNEVS